MQCCVNIKKNPQKCGLQIDCDSIIDLTILKILFWSILKVLLQNQNTKKLPGRSYHLGEKMPCLKYIERHSIYLDEWCGLIFLSNSEHERKPKKRKSNWIAI